MTVSRINRSLVLRLVIQRSDRQGGSERSEPATYLQKRHINKDFPSSSLGTDYAQYTPVWLQYHEGPASRRGTIYCCSSSFFC